MRESKRLILRALILLCAACLLAGTLYLAGCMADAAPASGGVHTGGDTALQAWFIDVGQGDAILIQSGTLFMLIDAGTAQSAGSLVTFLQEHGVDRLRFVVATHPHADHIGGMADVLDAFPVDTFIMPQAVHTTATFENMLDAVERNGCDAVYGAAGQQYTLGSAKIDLLWPQEGEFSGNNLNNTSLVLALMFDDVRMLLMGDAESEVEQALAGEIGGFHLLKVGHHGSKTSSSAAFLEAVLPAHAVISCGAGNEYGHPHAETLETLADSVVWRTDQNGTITVTVEGGQMHVRAQR